MFLSYDVSFLNSYTFSIIIYIHYVLKVYKLSNCDLTSDLYSCHEETGPWLKVSPERYNWAIRSL